MEGEHLKNLGSQKTEYDLSTPCISILETFENQYPENDYIITLTFPEFTSLCPKTKQPDFATIKIEYTPDKKCIETKSFKLYLFSYRQYGSFMETITNKILEDCFATCLPKYMKVTGIFNPRGGTYINVESKRYNT